ncbi:MAG TPA: porin family protein [Bacteroidales bacterium]|nr:porin family protein [Bacteroidales bacterium]
MKYLKIFTISFSLLVCFSFTSTAQRFLGAVSAGMNLTQVDGEEVIGFKKVGFNGGPSVIFPFGKNKKWSVTMELLYSQNGSYRKEQYLNDTIFDSTEYYDGYRLTLNYIQIPLIVHFTDKNFIAGGLGVQYGRLMSFKEYEDKNDPRGLHRTDSLKFNTSDIQILADFRLRVYKRLWFNLRYSYSILPIRIKTFENPFTLSTWTRKQYNNVLTFRVVYIFNESNPKKIDPNSEQY